MSTIEPAAEVNPALFRRVMGRFASGVTVITAAARGETRGMTATAFMSGSLDPPLCVISVANRAQMHGHLLDAGCFAVNILSSGQQDVSSHFAGRPVPTLEIVFADVGGIPTLAHASACITAQTVATHECGDHTIFIGHIRHVVVDDRPPLLYHAGKYGSLLPDAV